MDKIFYFLSTKRYAPKVYRLLQLQDLFWYPSCNLFLRALPYKEFLNLSLSSLSAWCRGLSSSSLAVNNTRIGIKPPKLKINEMMNFIAGTISFRYSCGTKNFFRRTKMIGWCIVTIWLQESRYIVHNQNLEVSLEWRLFCAFLQYFYRLPMSHLHSQEFSTPQSCFPSALTEYTPVFIIVL